MHNLTKELKIAYWNADDIKEKINELKIFLVDYDIDIMLPGETWL